MGMGGIKGTVHKALGDRPQLMTKRIAIALASE